MSRGRANAITFSLWLWLWFFGCSLQSAIYESLSGESISLLNVNFLWTCGIYFMLLGSVCKDSERSILFLGFTTFRSRILLSFLQLLFAIWVEQFGNEHNFFMKVSFASVVLLWQASFSSHEPGFYQLLTMLSKNPTSIWMQIPAPMIWNMKNLPQSISRHEKFHTSSKCKWINKFKVRKAKTCSIWCKSNVVSDEWNSFDVFSSLALVFYRRNVKKGKI